MTVQLNAAARLKVLAAVPLSLVKPYMANFNRNRYAAIFNKYGTGKGKDKYRIYIPLGKSILSLPTKVTIPPQIEEFLASQGMVVDNYLAGTALDKRNRTIRIGKLLSSNPEIKKIYDNDSQRAGSKVTNAWVVISRHPYDIVGMSFDRGWTSCMHASDGQERRYLHAEVAEGALVAYLVKETDKNINSPSARISIRPYANDRNHILNPSKVYGTAPQSFIKVINTFCKWINSAAPDGMYELAGGLYGDDDTYTVFHLKDSQHAGNQPVSHRRSLADNVGTSSEILHILARDSDWHVRVSVAENASTDPDDLEFLANDEDDELKCSVAENRNTPSTALANLAKSRDVVILEAVAEHRNTPPSLLPALAKHPAATVRACVAYNRNTSADILKVLADDKETEVRREVAGNPATPKECLLELAKDARYEVKMAVSSNPNLDYAVLESLSKDKNANVSYFAKRQLDKQTLNK